ncbi:nuclear transport factor 2 family protein [Photobacterium sp.]|uniref:nuclear transport factor 2 family protein n=1 Tax=Photobacterium sp. TaxID=660 RepID=UPI00299DA6BE|nr:nuclear transport factor 2 family protein [Photobacterium sp.]MDX1301439.1 nuclear transport factor 2 family protein [Photobacterium sp.]
MSAPSNKTIAHFIDTYSQLTKNNLAELEDIYHQDVVFEDPAHRIDGWNDLHHYFKNLYSTINSCEFVVHSWLADETQAFVQWTMTFSHPDLEKGRLRRVEGCSQLQFKDDRVIYHRDYFDLGEMIYEGVPLLGKVIRHIKTRLGQ